MWLGEIFGYYTYYIFFGAIAVTTISILWYCNRINHYWRSKGVFTLPPKLFIGNLKEVMLLRKTLGEQIREFYDTLKMKEKGYGGFYFLMRPSFVIADLVLMKRVLVTDFDHFADHPIYANEDLDPLRRNLFCVKGERWRRLRSILTPVFTSAKLRTVFPVLLDCFKQLEAVVDEKAEIIEAIDIHHVISELNMSIIIRSAFGIKNDSLSKPNLEIRKLLMQKLAYHGVTELVSFAFPQILTWFKISMHRRETTRFFINHVQAVVKHRNENTIVQNDIMHLLLELTKKKEDIEEGEETPAYSMGEVLSIEEIAANCLVFVIAGHETVSFTTSYCIYELSMNKPVQDRARDEIDQVLVENGGNVTYEALSNMEFLDRCIYETLRKYPPGSLYSRVCTKSYQVPNSDIVLPKGMPVFISTYGCHMDPEYYPNPTIFDPERFSKENKSKRPSIAWIPFGYGPRSCIASKFGLLEVKVGLVTLLRRYKFSLHPSTAVPMKFQPLSYTLNPSSTILVDAEKRMQETVVEE